jgi:hypothetical protein
LDMQLAAVIKQMYMHFEAMIMRASTL